MQFAELVPQVFYDFIARVVTGLTLLATVGAMWNANLANTFIGDLARGLNEAPISVVLAFITLAYVIAFCIEGLKEGMEFLFIQKEDIANVEPLGRDPGNIKKLFSWLLSKTRIVYFPNNQKLWDDAKLTIDRDYRSFCKNIIPDTLPIYPPLEAVALDSLRIISPGVGARIVKLRAEVAMCASIATGFLVIFIVTWLPLSINDPPAMPIYENFTRLPLTRTLLVLAMIAVFIRKLDLETKYIQAIYNHWILLIYPGVNCIKKVLSDIESTSRDDEPKSTNMRGYPFRHR